MGGLKLAVTITSSESVNQHSKACIQHLKAETRTPTFLVMSKPFFPQKGYYLFPCLTEKEAGQKAGLL